MKSKNLKVLVTGGAGFIGSHLVDSLINQNYKVVVIDNLSTGKIENLNPKAKFYKIDICSDKIKKIFKIEMPDFVFHLAALPRVPLSIKDPVKTSKVNVYGSVNIFKSAIDVNVKRIIFASSSSVYGEQKKMPLKESMKENPISPYALQKLTAEKFAKLFSELYKIPIICLRYFNVYGPRIDFSSDYSLVIGKFLLLKSKGKPLTIYGDGNQTRSFTFIDDVIKANILAMKSNKLKGGEVLNIGSSKSYTINYLADIIGGKKIYLPERKGDIKHTKADIKLAKKLLSWEPKIDFKKGIEITKHWFENYKN